MALSNSIVDYLNQRGQGSSFKARQQLASQMGMTGYRGTASQNTSLLNQLRNNAGLGGNNTPSANVTAGMNAQGNNGGAVTTAYSISQSSRGGNGNYEPRKYAPSQQVQDAYKAYSARLSRMPDDYSESDEVEGRREQLRNVEANRPDPFKSKYQDQISNLLDGIYNQKKFSYTGKDLQNDDVYKMYAQRYSDSARRAMQDTMANAQAQSGGYGSSYAAQVAQQAYDNQMNGLTDKALDFRDRAYQMYRDDQANQYNKLQAFQGQDNTDYGRYRDTVTDWQNDRNYFLNALNGERAHDLNVYNANTSNYWNGTNHLAGQYNADRSADMNSYKMDNDNLNFDREMAMKEEQWAKEYAMKKEAQDLDNELARLNIDKTKQALAGMVAGGSRGGGGGSGRRGRRGRASKQTAQQKVAGAKRGNGLPTVNVYDLMDSVSHDFGKGANNVLATPRADITPQKALEAIYANDGEAYHLDTMPDDPLTYITRNELRKAREKRGF